MSRPVVGCVVIHHRNLGVLPRTVGAFREQGIDTENILVVDNSEDAVDGEVLSESLTPGIRLARIPNLGYGNAANIGVEMLLKGEDPPELILISTHEVQPGPGTVDRLVDGLGRDRRRLVAGPRLETTLPDGCIRRSCGGIRSRFLGVPMHRLCEGEGHETEECEWVDGSLVLYRAEFLRRNPFREDFFLYYEESELHCRLSDRPGAVVCVTGASASESAQGVPPFLRGRNLQWFLQLHGNRIQRAFSVPLLVAKLVAKVLLGRATADAIRPTISGWWFARSNPLVSAGPSAGQGS